ncbi:tRNA methyltransferase complex GCD14 subunit-domain-containing protein [Kockiozyma suomiensis]|uniref:tRNA methyltransferase complex GCD14 subunit-domain-containing protein n=1 Tax=Kockiozyma suomiensis TaxID=1337062 RepID=UPI0033442096
MSEENITDQKLAVEEACKIQQTSHFLEFSTVIKENDLVLAWLTRDNTKPIRPIKDGAFHTRFGSFQHNTILASKYGTQIGSSSSTQAGFIHVLHPTPELWSLSLPHRTQIVYTPDASYIVQRLRIRPGTHVIEAGTGSASFTHAMARTVGVRGRIWTFEFHEQRFQLAAKELEEHGLASVVKATHGDVCKNGFTHSCGDTLDASAVFLDLPAPWEAIPHLTTVISKSKITRICCFSPCMEQVQRTIEILQKNGWLDIEMVEVSCKRWEAHKEMVRKPEDAIERLRDIKRRRMDGLNKRNARVDAERATLNLSADNADTDSATDTDRGKFKKANKSESPSSAEFNPWGKGKRIHEGEEGYEWKNVSKVEAELKTHTSYLTFAYLPPPMRVHEETINCD